MICGNSKRFDIFFYGVVYFGRIMNHDMDLMIAPEAINNNLLIVTSFIIYKGNLIGKRSLITVGSEVKNV